MSKNNLKSSQKQSVVVKIEDTTYKRRRPKRKIGVKKIPIINTGPFVTGISASPSMTPGSASTQSNISPFFQPRAVIASGPPIIQRPIDEPHAYNSLFQGPGRLIQDRLLNPRPEYLRQFSSDIQEVPSPYKNRSPSIYSINSEDSEWSRNMPEEFRSVASQNLSSGLSLEKIDIPQQGMGSNISPVKMEDYLSGGNAMASAQDIQNAMKGMSQPDYPSYDFSMPPGFSDDQIQTALTYNSLIPSTPVKEDAESKKELQFL